jgi:hypothetical protein
VRPAEKELPTEKGLPTGNGLLAGELAVDQGGAAALNPNVQRCGEEIEDRIRGACLTVAVGG